MASSAFEPARLRTARLVWWAATGVVATVAVVAPLVIPDPGTTVPAVLPAVLAASTVAAALVGVVVLDRGLTARTPDGPDDAGRELTSRLVLQIAVLEAPALLAVALAAVVGPPWVVLVGAVPVLAGLLWLRPSAGRLRRLEAAWQRAGPGRADPRG